MKGEEFLKGQYFVPTFQHLASQQSRTDGTIIIYVFKDNRSCETLFKVIFSIRQLKLEMKIK